ncbi:ATP-grasp domain-containing protein [Burkholderia territorii]|uniref:ATP-grasp domain-containing protein n=1 Tax=Burkholderia territorii TaxID=1503055 RepID=UPI0009C1A809|nr:ATP-grasp domain-containing protein [Burkholderia territorii]
MTTLTLPDAAAPPLSLTAPSAGPVVLVDAYSTGALLARTFRTQARCMHVRSRSAMPEVFRASVPNDIFEASDTLDERGVDTLAHRVAAWQPCAVVAASEFGVELADALAERLGLPGNTTQLSGARRNKFLMGEALAAANVPAAGQLRAADLDTLLAWHAANGGRRIVVKPLDSAGSDHVYLCDDAEQIATAFHAIKGKTNLMMCENDAVLAQDYLEGEEYVVNSVSHCGLHRITDIWHSRKIELEGGRKIYDCEDLVDPDQAEIAQLVQYVSRALDALGIAHGPAHTELILTPNGPRLLETGARISGLANPAALRRATGADQIELTVACHLAPQQLAHYPPTYRRKTHARCVNLIAPESGGAFSHDAVRALLAPLASFESIRLRLADGALLRRTVDLNSSPGALFLVHDDPEQIKRDYQTIRTWENRSRPQHS